jgi:hypothetical protein
MSAQLQEGSAIGNFEQTTGNGTQAQTMKADTEQKLKGATKYAQGDEGEEKLRRLERNITGVDLQWGSWSQFFLFSAFCFASALFSFARLAV